MLEQLFTTIIEWLRTTIIIGFILYPMRIYLLRRKVVVSKQNCNLCQKLHEALDRLVDNPKSRVLREYVACLNEDLQNRRSINYRQNKIKQELEKLFYPSIRWSLSQYEKEKDDELYGRLLKWLSPVLFRRPPAIEDTSLSLKIQHEFAKECTQGLAIMYVFHSNQAKDFIEESPILRFLPYAIKVWIYR